MCVSGSGVSILSHWSIYSSVFVPVLYYFNQNFIKSPDICYSKSFYLIFSPRLTKLFLILCVSTYILESVW